MKDAQKIVKYVAIAFAILLMVGILTGIYQLGNIIGSYFGGSNVNKEFTTQEYSEEVSILHIDIGASKLKIEPGSIVSVKTNNEYVESDINNSKLEVIEKKHSVFNSNGSEVIITIPSDQYFKIVDIKTGAGSIDLKNINTESLQFEMGAGEVKVEDLKVTGMAKVEGGAGSVKILKSEINNLDLNLGVGEFNLQAILTGTTKVEAGIGAVNISLLDSIDNYNFEVSKGIGSIKIDNQSMKDNSTYGEGMNKIQLKGGIGSITINTLK